MERPIVAALNRLGTDFAGGDGGSAFLAAASGGSLATALLPLVGLIAAFVAAVAVGSLLVAWLQKPKGSATGAVTDPRTAGLLAVGFVSGAAAKRWLSATVVQLACEGVIAIEDRRDGIDAGPAKDIRLVFDSDPGVAHAGAESGDTATGSLVAIFERGLLRGSTQDVDRVVERNDPLLRLTQRGFRDAADAYREQRPAARFRAASVGGVAGVLLGLLSLGFAGDAADSVAWSAILFGATALAMRILLARLIPLNAAGLELRERASALRESLAAGSGTDAGIASVSEQVLPWAVLFDESSVIRRFAESAERSGGAPAWFRSTADFSADRLVSALAITASELSQPIRVGGGVLQRDSGRFGVPLLDDYKGWGRGYIGYGGYGAFGGAEYGGGGFDGGAGYDGGGFGGGDGGGGN